MNKGERRELIKKLHIQDNRTMQEIATLLDCTRQNINYYKKRDQQRGIDWEQEKIKRERDAQSLDKKEEIFLANLFEMSENFFKAAKLRLDSKTLESLVKYASLYYKIKNTKKYDEKQTKIKAYDLIIKTIATIAQKNNNAFVCDFLRDKGKEIIDELYKSL